MLLLCLTYLSHVIYIHETTAIMNCVLLYYYVILAIIAGIHTRRSNAISCLACREGRHCVFRPRHLNRQEPSFSPS